MTALDTSTLEGILADDVEFISRYFTIPDKDQNRVPFVPKPAQRKIDRELTQRHIIVKPSQIGCTSWLTAKYFKHTMFQADTTAVIVAHEAFLAQRLLSRTEVFYNSVPEAIRPYMDHNSASEKRFPKINSVMYIGTARAQVFGRGEPIHRLLFSEAGFYQQETKQKIILPALQRVPIDGYVTIESTPNGEDPYFYDEALRAVEGKGSFHLTVLFWWDEPTNTLPEGHPLALRGDEHDLYYTIEEQLLVDAHELLQDQIRWRRWKIEELGEFFWQEHLESIDTCFLVAGDMYYDTLTVKEFLKNSYAAPSSFMNAEVWHQPEEGGEYVIGLDPGQGKITESVAEVYRIFPDMVRHEACLSGFIDATEMGRKGVELATYYNTALLVAESNGHGLATIAQILRERYSRMYYRTDIISGRRSMTPGWLTTTVTKPFMMQELGRRLMNMESHHGTLAHQLGQVREVGGKVVFLGMDDHHDAAGLAMVGLSSYKAGGKYGYRGTTGRYETGAYA